MVQKPVIPKQESIVLKKVFKPVIPLESPEVKPMTGVLDKIWDSYGIIESTKQKNNLKVSYVTPKKETALPAIKSLKAIGPKPSLHETRSASV